MQVVVGQRWSSSTESELGLGIVRDVAGRRLTIDFPAAEETRVYALDGAPLTRIRYAPGDRVRDAQGQSATVERVDENDGLLNYRVRDADGHRRTLAEAELDAFVQFTTPRQRLLSGQSDRRGDFALRLATLTHLDRLQRSAARGLLGCRTSLLPHQLHIASSVAARQEPRVLLADEVGLGKTIEAGMILHQQRHAGQARRVLVLVPDGLVHQWLVEMLRRFNLRFSVFDAQRLEAARHDQAGNPFESEQLVLCALDLLVEMPGARVQALAAPWDMVIVDEAHHLEWRPAERVVTPGEVAEADAAPDELRDESVTQQRRARRAYRCVQVLAARSAGLLLLTATPEQLGVASHFARLRLLDPARFHSLAAFLDEEAGYRQLSSVVDSLLEADAVLSAEQRAMLAARLDEAVDALPDAETRARLLQALLDRHGTGRVLFRNTRAAVAGFPLRRPQGYALPAPVEFAPDRNANLQQRLFPECLQPPEVWLNCDPRVAWLLDFLRADRERKVLVICHLDDTARELEKHLVFAHGIRSAGFHAGMSIIERDRAAAYFAETRDDPGGGAQVLVCSEIGSEGRNFQFAHHLVLFDLPASPDLLEQRIGRLDRIGQSEDVNIHVPYLDATAQAVLYLWYRDGLGLLQRSFAAGAAVRDHFAACLDRALRTPDDQAGLQALVADTASYASQIADELRAGRDRLLELNSNDPQRAAELIAAIEQEENSDALRRYCELLFDQHGVEHDFHSADALVLRPGDSMSAPFPELPEDGVTVTWQRAKALVREDMQFLSWEHPMLTASMDAIVNSDFGNSHVATLALKNIAAGTLLLEAVFTLHAVAPPALRLTRYLPLSPQRLVIGPGGKDMASALPAERLATLCKAVKTDIAARALAQVRPRVDALVARAVTLANERLPALRATAARQMRAELDAELQRLRALAQVNPGVRPREIEQLQRRIDDSEYCIAHADLRLEALRLIVSE